MRHRRQHGGLVGESLAFLGGSGPLVDHLQPTSLVTSMSIKLQKNR